MRFQNVHIAAIGYELPNLAVTSAALEERLAPVFDRLRIPRGQLAAMTGIHERRWWPQGTTLSAAAATAAAKCIRAARFSTEAIDTIIYAGVCRENLEPATACAVAHQLGIGGARQVYDVSNACLGVLNGMLQVAALIEAGFTRAGLICSAETAQQIVELMTDRLLREPTMERFKSTLATLTGGSGAAAVLLAHRDLAPRAPRLVGAAVRAAPEFHQLCRWGPDTGQPSSMPMTMETHAIGVLENGVALGVETWRDFQRQLPTRDDATRPTVDRTICHQVGAANRDSILRAIEIAPENDFVTYDRLGNIGTVSLPLSAAVAAETGFLRPGQRVGLLGIGSGLNCLMLGVDW